MTFAEQMRLSLFSILDNDRTDWANLPHFRAPLSLRERDERRWLFSGFFIRTGDGSSAFPETVRARQAQRFIHHGSQLHRLFILLERPTSETRPIKFCHLACHLAHINPNTLSFLLILPLYSSCPICLYSSVSPSLPSVAPLLFSLLMRSELVLKIMM